MKTSPSPQVERSPLGSLVAEQELRQFLKIARPEWSKPRRSGRCDIERVILKLKEIGIKDIESLLQRVESNTINEELHSIGRVPLSREALSAIRKQRIFLLALENVDVPNVRQVGARNPVAQMLSSKRLAVPHRSQQSYSPPATAVRDGQAMGKGLRMSQSDGNLAASWSSDANYQTIWTMESTGSVWDFGSVPRLRGAQDSRRRQQLRPLNNAPHHTTTIDQFDLPRQLSKPDSSSQAGNINKVTWSSASLNENDSAEVGTRGGQPGRLRSYTTASRLSDESSLVPETPPQEELLLLQRTGKKILRDCEDPLASAPRWSQRSLKTPLEQGEDMLNEQSTLAEKDKLLRSIIGGANRYVSDPFRSHVTENIKTRMKEELKHDTSEALAISQKCMNIRKHLAGLMNARREIAGLRAKVGAVLEEPIGALS